MESDRCLFLDYQSPFRLYLFIFEVGVTKQDNTQGLSHVSPLLHQPRYYGPHWYPSINEQGTNCSNLLCITFLQARLAYITCSLVSNDFYSEKNTIKKPNQATLRGLYSPHTPVQFVYEMLEVERPEGYRLTVS